MAEGEAAAAALPLVGTEAEKRKEILLEQDWRYETLLRRARIGKRVSALLPILEERATKPPPPPPALNPQRSLSPRPPQTAQARLLRHLPNGAPPAPAPPPPPSHAAGSPSFRRYNNGASSAASLGFTGRSNNSDWCDSTPLSGFSTPARGSFQNTLQYSSPPVAFSPSSSSSFLSLSPSPRRLSRPLPVPATPEWPDETIKVRGHTYSLRALHDALSFWNSDDWLNRVDRVQTRFNERDRAQLRNTEQEARLEMEQDERQGRADIWAQAWETGWALRAADGTTREEKNTGHPIPQHPKPPPPKETLGLPRARPAVVLPEVLPSTLQAQTERRPSTTAAGKLKEDEGNPEVDEATSEPGTERDRKSQESSDISDEPASSMGDADVQVASSSVCQQYSASVLAAARVLRRTVAKLMVLKPDKAQVWQRLTKKARDSRKQQRERVGLEAGEDLQRLEQAELTDKQRQQQQIAKRLAAVVEQRRIRAATGFRPARATKAERPSSVLLLTNMPKCEQAEVRSLLQGFNGFLKCLVEVNRFKVLKPGYRFATVVNNSARLHFTDIASAIKARKELAQRIKSTRFAQAEASFAEVDQKEEHRRRWRWACRCVIAQQRQQRDEKWQQMLRASSNRGKDTLQVIAEDWRETEVMLVETVRRDRERQAATSRERLEFKKALLRLNRWLFHREERQRRQSQKPALDVIRVRPDDVVEVWEGETATADEDRDDEEFE
eukprot:TRINITY_DN24647_c0_g1_i1.p1 TRINITY_DN24647_c0_g1~~TRINITY_DN24647_c0_g1_i1.p1  ORF type:complete len:794 (-),score=133.99 TRINITY_DN24647_c0_g1_i1:75-2252(-)